MSTPRTFTGVEGFQRGLFAPNGAVAPDGTPLQFGGWSDGKSIRHVITTPDNDTTYTATYVPSQPFTGRYYNNTTFSGAPVLTRQDQNVNFAWGSSSPGPGLPADDFAVRWTKTQHFGAGRYQFTTVADDGVRLFIDGKRVIGQWQGPANTEFAYTADLGEGKHTIKMDYVEQGGDATAALSWDAAPTQPSDTYRAEYWNVAGPPAIPGTTPDLALDEEAIDHDWGAGSPGPVIGADRFVARWTRTISVAPGDYEFAATADDGVRLYVDGVRVIDKWTDQAGPATYRTTLPLDGGPHRVVMEYYENNGGAVARLGYSQVAEPAADTGYHAEYWNTPGATGPPTIPTGPADLQRQDETLDFNWGGASPGAGIAADRFVARWTKTVTLSAGLYRFTGARDDGIRAYIDNLPIIDDWSSGSETYSVDKVVASGPHELRVEYFEGGGGAQAEFTYDRIGEVASDTSPPSAPTGLSAAAVSASRIDLTWAGSTDDVGVTSYRVERCQGQGCTDFAEVATPTATTYSDTGLSPSTTYRYRVRAVDSSGNLGGYSAVAQATTGPPVSSDTTPPTASVTAPAAGSVVSGNVTVSASASDNVGVAGVQFLLDGASLGAEDTTAPYSMAWDTATASNGVHTLQARARDTAGNLGTSSSVTVTVSNSAPPPPAGLVAGWAFNESFGPTVNDASGNGNTATLQNGPTWTSGRYGGGLQFDGVNDFLTALNSASLNISGNAMTMSMWINPLAGAGAQVPFAKFWSGTMSSPYYQYGLELDGGTTPHIYFGTAGGLRGASMASPLAVGQWSHLAIVFDGTQARFYVNGNLVSSAPLAASITARNSPLQMGADTSPWQFYKGALDDVRLYNRAESPLEVQNDMNTPLGAPTGPSPPTITSTSPDSPANDNDPEVKGTGGTRAPRPR